MSRKSVVIAAAGWPRAWERGGLIGAGVGATVRTRPNRSRTSNVPVVQSVAVDTTVLNRTMASTASTNMKVLNEDNIYENIKKMEYAVRGPLLIRANEIEKELQKVRFNLSPLNILS